MKAISIGNEVRVEDTAVQHTADDVGCFPIREKQVSPMCRGADFAVLREFSGNFRDALEFCSFGLLVDQCVAPISYYSLSSLYGQTYP